MKYHVDQRSLTMSQCQHFCGRTTADVERLLKSVDVFDASRVPLPQAILVRILTVVESNAAVMNINSARPHSLKNEAMFVLAENINNWRFDGEQRDATAFWALFYDEGRAVRKKLGPLISCRPEMTSRSLRYHSQSDIRGDGEPLNEADTSGSTARFIINAQTLADELQSVCGPDIFSARLII